MNIVNKKITINHISGPLGLIMRNFDNKLIYDKLGRKSTKPLKQGLEKTYSWIKKQVERTI